MKIKIDPNVHLQDLMAQILRGGDEDFTAFMLMPDNNLYLSTEIHNVLARRLKTDKQACPIGDGSFRFIPNTSEIRFYYHPQSFIGDNIHEAAENKIKAFLASKGIEIKKTSYRH